MGVTCCSGCFVVVIVVDFVVRFGSTRHLRSFSRCASRVILVVFRGIWDLLLAERHVLFWLFVLLLLLNFLLGLDRRGISDLFLVERHALFWLFVFLLLLLLVRFGSTRHLRSFACWASRVILVVCVIVVVEFLVRFGSTRHLRSFSRWAFASADSSRLAATTNSITTARGTWM